MSVLSWLYLMTGHSALCKIMTFFSPLSVYIFLWFSLFCLMKQLHLLASFFYTHHSLFFSLPLFSPFLLLVHCHQTISTLFIYWRSIKQRRATEAKGKSKWKGFCFIYSLSTTRKVVDFVKWSLSVKLLLLPWFLFSFSLFSLVCFVYLFIFTQISCCFIECTRKKNTVREAATTIQGKVCCFKSSPQPAIGFCCCCRILFSQHHTFTFFNTFFWE